MKSFEWVQPASIAEAVDALQKPGAMALAGGVDLLDRMKERIAAPTRLVSLRKLPDLRAIDVRADGTRIGANVTLAELAADAKLRASHSIVGEAASHAATPQLRAMATLGGNLAQRPRCWYFRSESFDCRKKGGTTCFAHAGENEMHALFANKTCAATHPSTIVTALLALGASVEVMGKQARTVPLAKFFVAPETDVKREVDLAPGELITAVTIPPTKAKTAYTKQVAKQSFDWPLVDCAVAIDGKTMHVVLGAVAPTPYRAIIALSSPIDEQAARAHARAIVAKATPLRDNAYKLPIVEAVITRTILAARAS